jgi:putative acetyltransferase
VKVKWRGVSYLGLAEPCAFDIAPLMIIRREGEADRAAIYRVVSDAFGGPAEAQLVDQLREDGDLILSLVAEDAGEIIGHLALSKMTAPCPALALAPLSVISSRRGGGVGSRLVEAAINEATEIGWRAIFVLGDPQYYRRFGFSIEAAAGFTSPYAGAQFMAQPLISEPIAKQGVLTHAPAFAAMG